MDEVDRAQIEIEHAIVGSVAALREREQVAATGACLNCGSRLRAGLRWCDAGCRDDWSRLRARVPS